MGRSYLGPDSRKVTELLAQLESVLEMSNTYPMPSLTSCQTKKCQYDVVLGALDQEWRRPIFKLPFRHGVYRAILGQSFGLFNLIGLL